MQEGVRSSSSSAKSVTFAAKAKMRLALHISEYDPKEMEASFYSNDDFTRFRVDAKITARLIESGHRASDIEFCGRGVEGLTRGGMAQQSINRKIARLAVMMEQAHFRQQAAQQQHPSEEDNPAAASTPESAIAAAYATTVSASISLAQNLGRSDEKFVHSKLTMTRNKLHRRTRIRQPEKGEESSSKCRRTPLPLANLKKHGNLRLVRRINGTSAAA
jgi:hypothetical protein